MENNIFKVEKADTKPVAKLVQTIWTDLYKPYGIRREAKAKSDARLIEIKGDIEAQGLLATLEGRSTTRGRLTELRRQRNLESIVQGSIQYLPESVSDEQVDPDWTAQFFNNCQDVSNEEMQSLWSKILAGEVSKPGAYSLRTLDVVRKLRKRDAELFTEFSAFVSIFGGHGGYLVSHDAHQYVSAKGHDHSLQLDAIGLLTYAQSIELKYGDENEPAGISYYDRLIHIRPFHGLKLYPLTDVGRELFPICGSKKDDTYWSLLMADWKRRGVHCFDSDTRPSNAPLADPCQP